MNVCVCRQREKGVNYVSIGFKYHDGYCFLSYKINIVSTNLLKQNKRQGDCSLPPAWVFLSRGDEWDLRHSLLPIDLSCIRNLALGFEKVTMGSFHLREPDLLQS